MESTTAASALLYLRQEVESRRDVRHRRGRACEVVERESQFRDGCVKLEGLRSERRKSTVDRMSNKERSNHHTKFKARIPAMVKSLSLQSTLMMDLDEAMNSWTFAAPVGEIVMRRRWSGSEYDGTKNIE